MQRLTIRINERLAVRDINCNLISLNDVPTELLGCIYKLKDYEDTGYNADFIDTLSYILEDMKERLANPSAINIKSCVTMIDYIINAKEKAVSECDC